MPDPSPASAHCLLRRPILLLAALALAVHAALGLWYVLTPTAGDAAASGFPLDDAWIHMVYGRNLASHGAPLYNDSLEAGFTSPLWMFALALAHLAAAVLPAGPVFFAKLFSVLAAAATSTAVGGLALRFSGNLLAAAFATLLCAANPVLAFAQVSGMEVAVTTAAAALAVLALVDGRHGRAGLWLALAYWGRPECLLLALLAAVVPFADRAIALRERTRRAALLLAPVGLAGALWAGYCLAATGHPLPNTFHAKFDLAGQDALLPAMLAVLSRLPTSLWGAGGVLALAALLHLRPGPRGYALGLVLSFPLLFLFAVVRTRPCPEDAGAYFFFARYPAPAWPFVAAAVAIGAHAAWTRALALRTALPRRLALCAVAALLAIAVVQHPPALAAAAGRYAANCRNIDEVQVAFGRWTAANVPAGRAVAINDAGAIRYFGGRHTVDLLGLNDQRVLFAQPPLGHVFGDADRAADWLLAHEVDCAIVFPAWFAGLVRQPRFPARFQPVHTLASADYTIADPRSGQTTMVAYQVLPRADARPPR